MKKVLWLSRHTLTKEQRDDLSRIYGNIEVIQYDKSIETPAQIVEIGAECDVFAVVLPINLLEGLLKITDKPVIRAIANRVECGTIINPATGLEEKQFMFQHKAWEQVKKVEVITETL